MSRKPLHAVQAKLLELLRANADEPLTIRELVDVTGASSTSVVAHHLEQLERKGFIKQNPYNPRDYQVIAEGPEPAVAILNVYGLASCGPGGSILDGNPIDRIPIGTRLLSFPASEAFMVRAKGKSMEPKINEGDLVIARRCQVPIDGRTYVCVNDEQSLIKRVRSSGDHVILESFNTSFAPILACSDFRVEGEVRTIISGKP